MLVLKLAVAVFASLYFGH